MKRLTILTLAALAAAPAAFAQTVGDAAAGREIARTWCANCHVVDDTPSQVRDGVPSFPAIARQPSTTALSLQAFLQTPHARMPNFQLTRTQIDDAVAYILSLRR